MLNCDFNKKSNILLTYLLSWRRIIKTTESLNKFLFLKQKCHSKFNFGSKKKPESHKLINKKKKRRENKLNRR